MLESILMTLNAKEQESGVYVADSGCILPLLWKGISTLIPSHFTELLDLSCIADCLSQSAPLDF